MIKPTSPENADGTLRPDIPDYQLLRRIGRGSYGDVWLARGLTGVYRAIKVVWRDRYADAGPSEREFKGLKKFMSAALLEAGQLALLHVGHDEAAGFFYYVMELADDSETGREVNPAKYAPLTLKEVRTRCGRLPAEKSLKFGVELARALAGLHAHGLVHRDIKPSNIILVGGLPKLADIGLVADTATALSFVGTEGYVPPEGPGRPTADVYALGKVLYELSTGLDRQQFPQLPPDLNRLSDHRALLKLNEVILRACETNPARRYADGTAMLTDLEGLQDGSLRRSRPRRGLGRRAGAALRVAAVLGAGVWWWQRPSPAEPIPAPAGAEPAPAIARPLIERRPTENQVAYNLYMRGSLLANKFTSSSTRSEYDAVLALLGQAIALDPAFMPAHLGIANVDGVMYWYGRIDPSPERRAHARSELETARRLAPDSPGVRFAQGSFAYFCENDWERAQAEFRAVEASSPNDAKLQQMIGLTYRRLGQMQEALRCFERSATLNPRDLGNAVALLETMLYLRRYAQTYVRARGYAVMFPESDLVQSYLNRSQYALDGDRPAYLRALAAQPPPSDDPQGMSRDYREAMDAVDLTRAERLLAEPRFPPSFTYNATVSQPLALTRAELAVLRGDQVAAKRQAEEALAVYRAGRWSPRQELLVRLGIARAQACSGLVEEGMHGMQAGLKELAQRDRMLCYLVQPEVARTMAIVGRREEALACLRDLLAGPCAFTPNELRDDPYFASLKSDPRFEEILKSAKPL